MLALVESSDDDMFGAKVSLVTFVGLSLIVIRYFNCILNIEDRKGGMPFHMDREMREPQNFLL